MLKFNLGCGSDVRDGYVNVDLHRTHASVVVADLSSVPWPFESGCAGEILMLDFLEHLSWRCTDRALLECYRLLSDEGSLIVQVPDGDHLLRALVRSGEFLCNRCGQPMGGMDDACSKCGQSGDDVSEAAMRRLYGGQDYVGNFHNTCFTKHSLKVKAAAAGLTLVEFLEEEHQTANWNFKARFKRGQLW